MRLDEVMSFGGRFAGSFELSATDGTKVEQDGEYDLTVRVSVKETHLKSTRSGEAMLFFVVKPMDVSLTRSERTEAAPEPAPGPALLPVDEAGTIVMPEDCPTPGYHKTHRYCPSCSWTENYVADEWGDGEDAFVPTVDIGDAVVEIRDPRPAFAVEDAVVPHGVRISEVSPRSNVGGSSQADRDHTLADFLNSGAREEIVTP